MKTVSGELRDQREDLNKIISQSFINQMSGLFTVVNLDSKFLVANTTSLSWFGYQSSETIFDSSYCNFPCKVSEQHTSFVAQDRLVIDKKSPLKILGRFCYSGNKWRILFGEKYIIRNEFSDAIGIAAHFNDITAYNLIDTSRVFGFLEGKQTQKNYEQQVSYVLEKSYPDIVLTGRETECIFYILRGKTIKEVAKILDISPRTVETHFEHIKSKLNCSTKSQVIEKGISLGYMNIIPEKLFARLS